MSANKRLVADAWALGGKRGESRSQIHDRQADSSLRFYCSRRIFAPEQRRGEAGFGRTVNQPGVNQLHLTVPLLGGARGGSSVPLLGGVRGGFPKFANPLRKLPLITHEPVFQTLELRPICVEADAKEAEAEGRKS
jgi:hypothetical protein